LLSRLTIVSEGATEVGFVSALLERALGSSLEQHGIHVTDGGGHETTLDLLQAFSEGGVHFGGFADEEGKYPERWKRLSDKLGNLLFRWTKGCLDENIINLVPDDRFLGLIRDPDGKAGMRLRSLARRLGIEDKTLPALREKAGAGLKAVIVEAALGKIPPGKEADKREYSSDSQTWFKTEAGGRELAAKMFSLGLWPALKPQLLPFCNAALRANDHETSESEEFSLGA
jgi:putative ATP-dependent endonuclease of OLD family